MALTNLAGLWMLVLIPVLILIHSLHQKSVKKEVTTLFLWEEILKEQKDRVSMTAFLKNRSLIFQILVILCLSLALAGPVLFSKHESTGRHIFLMDTSASMKTLTGEGTRFDKARSHAVELIKDLGNDGRVMIINAGHKPEIAQAFTHDKNLLLSAVEKMMPREVPGSMEKAVYLALSFLPPDEPGKIHVITDGAGYDLAALTRLSDRIVPVMVGGGQKNIAATLFEIRQQPGKKETYEILMEIKNYSAFPLICPVLVRTGDTLIAEHNIGLDSQEKKTLIFPFEGKIEEHITGEIRVDDDLPLDNKVFAVLKDPPKTRVFLVSKGNYFLEKFLSVYPGITVNSSPDIIPASFSDIAERNDIVILDNIEIPKGSRGNFLLLNAVSQDIPVRQTGWVQNPKIIDWNKKNPLTRGISLDGLFIESAMKSEARPPTAVLVEAKETPLVMSFHDEKIKAIIFGFDISKTDLPLRAAFPLLMNNIFEWLHPVSTQFSSAVIKAGQPYEIQLHQGPGEVAVRRPSNTWDKIKKETGVFVYETTDEAGVYKIRENKTSQSFCVNLADEKESDIRMPDEGLILPALKEKMGTGREKSSATPLWRLFLTLAVLMVATETLVFIKKKTPGAIVVKTLLILLLILALADIRLKKVLNQVNLMVCLDVSRSTQPADSSLVKRLLDNIGKQMHKKDTAGLIAFGKEPFVEDEPGPGKIFDELKTAPDKERTNIEKAILAAIGKFPEKGDNKILLVSDGNENLGNAIDAAMLARSLGIEIWSVPLNSWFEGTEVYMESLQTPETLDLYTPFDGRIILSSTAKTSGELILTRDNVLLLKKKTDFSPGKNLITFSDSLETPGVHVYRAIVNAENDTVFENNEYLSFTMTHETPKLLYLSETRPSAFAEALKTQGMEMDFKAQPDLSDSLNAFLGYEAVIIDNVPAVAFSMAEMEHMESFVKDAGGGLILLGGEKSFGAGFYLNTPVENVLPVFMDPPAPLEKPEFCLVLIIDKSSSMSGSIEHNTKLQGAKIASFSVVELLSPMDRIGLLAFDTEFKWVVPIMPAKDRETIAKELSKLSAEGGTDLFPALSHAFDTLKTIDAQKKHVIILSDGETEKADFKTLVSRMAKEGISISTVAVGSGSDRDLMQKIAEWGKGRSWYTNDADRIPRIFAGDTKIAAQAAFVEEVLPTILESKGEMLSGMPLDILPDSDGMAVTYPKPDAAVLFATQKGPLLASRQYGLGRSIAFTGAFTGKWGKKWVEWPHFEQLASQMVKWVKKSEPVSVYTTHIKRNNDTGTLAVDVTDTSGQFINNAGLNLSLLFPSKQKQNFPLRQTAPGRYEADFPAHETGEYYLTLYPAPGTAPNLPTRTFCMGIPYSEEYQSRGVNTALLQTLARATNGRLISITDPPTDLFDHTKQVMGPGKILWPWFVLFFAFIFILDAAWQKALELRRKGQVL